MDKTNNLYSRNLDDLFDLDIKARMRDQLRYEVLIFKQLGFCHIPNFLNEAAVNEIVRNLDTIGESHIAKHSAREKDGSVKVISYLDKTSDFFYDFMRHSHFKLITELLLSKKSTPLFCEYFNKIKYYGSFSPPHQDQIYYNEHFNDEVAIAFWISLDDVTDQNGYLQYFPGNGQSLQKHSQSKEIGFSKQLTSYNLEDYIPIFPKKGDCVIHHSLVPHFSNSNKSNKDRRAIVVNYRTSSYRQAHE